MSEIKALGKLRTAARNMAKGRNLENHEECNLLLLIADEIEREIVEHYMELPVDADGVPIHAGDLIEFRNRGERLEVTHFGWTEHGDPTIAYRRPNGTLDCSCIGTECRHVKPRTVEDVLREFAQCFCTDKINFDGSADGDTVAKYAAEIRELMEVDA